jgi:hypothetical protein
MSNSVAEQLATLRRVLERAGWTQTSAGRWRLNDNHLATAYVWGEATVTLTYPQGTIDQYRGAEPVLWLTTLKRAKNLVKELDTLADTP